jgi:hypothetical protein
MLHKTYSTKVWKYEIILKRNETLIYNSVCKLFPKKQVNWIFFAEVLNIYVISL